MANQTNKTCCYSSSSSYCCRCVNNNPKDGDENRTSTARRPSSTPTEETSAMCKSTQIDHSCTTNLHHLHQNHRQTNSYHSKNNNLNKTSSSPSFFIRVMLFSNASMLCMMLVQGFQTSPPSPLSSSSSEEGNNNNIAPNRLTSAMPSSGGSGDNNNNNNIGITERTRQVILATNTMPSANRFLQQQFSSTPSMMSMTQSEQQRKQQAPTIGAPAPVAMTTPQVITAQFRPTTSAEHKLYETLFKRSLYQKNVRPVQNHARSIKVRLGVCVMTIDEIIEKDQTMITSGCIKMKWSDEFLQWSPEAFQNLTWLVMPSTEIWLPDIALVNSPDPYTITRKPAFAEVTNTGQVGYYPSGRFSTRCAISLLFFPFDIQKCELRFESWVYPTQWLHIEPWEQNPIDMKDFYRNHQWDLERVSAIPGNISYDGLDFSTMRFIFYFRRRSLYYSVLSIFPGVLMSILQMFSHTLPVEHPARMTLLTSLFVSASVLQSSLASQMPKSSDGISLIQMYLMIFSSNLIISMVVTFINMHVWFRVPLAEVPNAIRMLRSFLLDTGGTAGHPIAKPIKAPQPHHPPSLHQPPAAAATQVTETTMVAMSSSQAENKASSMSQVNETAADQPTYSSRGEQTDDGPAEEETSLIVSYCCGTAVRQRSSGHSRRNGTNNNRRYAAEQGGVLRRRKKQQATETPPQKGPGSSSFQMKQQKQTPAPTTSSPSPASKKQPLIAVVQNAQSQLTERKERWLRFSMKVDKAFLYAMALFNTICPITIFFIVPQFQSYSDGET